MGGGEEGGWEEGGKNGASAHLGISTYYVENKDMRIIKLPRESGESIFAEITLWMSGRISGRTSVKGKKNDKLNFFCGRKWPVWDPVFDPKSTRKRFMWVPYLRSFPGNEAHKHFLGGASNGGGVGWGPKSLC